jgi:hypothetical protein
MKSHRTKVLCRSLTALAAVGLVSCGGGSNGTSSSTTDGGGGGATDAHSSGPDGSTDSSSGGGGSDAPSNDSSSSSDGAPFINGDVCGAPSGKVAWMQSIPAPSSTLNLQGIAFGPTSDAIVSDQSGTSYEQHRWDEKGAVVSLHQDPIGSYAGPISTSNLFVDAQNNLFYGLLLTGMTEGANSSAELTFTKLAPNGTVVSTDPHTNSMTTASGAPRVLVFDAGGDSGGGLHSAVTMADPQYFSAGVYCYASNGSFEGISAPGVTATMEARDFEWPNADSGMYITRRLTTDLDLGCGNQTVPAAGGMLLAQVDTGGNCVWNKLLALPTAAIEANDFRLGADGSLALAVVYTGTIDFGGGSLTSAGTSSLGVAHYDAKGTLLWSKSFGGNGSSFTLGSLGVNASGILMVEAGYAGAVNLGGGALPTGADTFIAVFDTKGNLQWNEPVTVGTEGDLMAAIGKCGVAVATNSPSVDLGSGPLSTVSSPAPPTIGVAALGL